MHSLFLKVFFWFWFSMVLVIGAFAITTHITRPEQPQPPQFIEFILTAYGRQAVSTYENEGQTGLDSYEQHMEREANIHARLFDANGKELAGRDSTPDEREIAARAISTGNIATKMLDRGIVLEARPQPARDGGNYTFVAQLPLAQPEPPGQSASFRRRMPPGPFGFLLGQSSAAFVARLAAVALTAGILCYWLARYIVSPVIKLREVTRLVAGGDLSARVSPALGNRRDELALMGRDFDAMTARIETLVNAQNRLLRDISHELRSPLARLSVALDLARKRAGLEAEAHLARIEREAWRLNEMIGQLLTLSRVESDGAHVRRETVNLTALVREVASDADFEAQTRSCAVTFVEAEECVLTGTSAMLRSAVENVVRNALRYTSDATTVKISLRCNDDEALISVRDEGAGVPEEALADIFRPFYRVDDSRTRETGGAGLGLAITERAIRLHGGSIKAANISGGGFVVELHIPFKHDVASF